MKLFYTDTSPFVRKVMVVASELGLLGEIETVFLRPTPLSPNSALSTGNPLSQIPALVLDDETTLYDSRVICEYLESLSPSATLTPKLGPERFAVLRQQALADGMLSAGILAFYEQKLRPKNLHWAPWIDGQLAKVRQGLDALDREAATFEREVDIGQIAAAVAVGWIEYRGLIQEIRHERASLFQWYDAFRARVSMQSTEPPKPTN